jgi:hypothetical protein
MLLHVLLENAVPLSPMLVAVNASLQRMPTKMRVNDGNVSANLRLLSAQKVHNLDVAFVTKIK